MLQSPLLPVGSPAFDFNLLDQHGSSLDLDKLLGPNGLILLLYASNWLAEDRRVLAAFRDAHEFCRQAGLAVAAMSGINWETQHHLAQELALPFPLLFDPCCRISQRYQAMMIPRFVTGRAVYGISPERRIVFARRQANPCQVLASFSG